MKKTIVNPRKAAVIGCGFVGSATAFALMQSHLFSELVLLDVNFDKADGEAKDICRLSGDGGGLEIGFNNRYLMEALRYAPADTVKIELNTGVSPAIIVPTEGEEKFLYMVLPVRLRAGE